MHFDGGLARGSINKAVTVDEEEDVLVRNINATATAKLDDIDIHTVRTISGLGGSW